MIFIKKMEEFVIYHLKFEQMFVKILLGATIYDERFMTILFT